MLKIKSSLLTILLMFCLLFLGSVANSQQKPLAEITLTSNQELAKAILSETGIAKRYDLYLGNVIDATLSDTLNTKFREWLNSLLVQEAGWKYVETEYINQLTANFSETELKELLDLAKQPLLKKLLQTENQSYLDTAPQRRKLLFKVWDNYNTGVFNPPPGVLP